MTLGHRVQLLLVAFFVLLTVNAGLAISDIRARDDVLAELQSLEPSRLLANDLTPAVVDQETSALGYVITRDPSYLEPYDDGALTTGSTLATLRSRFADDPEILAHVDRIEQSWKRWRREAIEPQLAAARDGAPGRPAELVSSGALRLFSYLRLDVRTLREAIDMRQAALEEELQILRSRLSTTLFVSFFLGLALLAAAALLLRRWITQPFAALSAAVGRVADGDRGHPIPQPGPADLAALGGDVERMRRLIVSQLEAEVRAREALEQQGPAVVTLRTELLPSTPALPETVRFAGRLVPAEGLLAGDWYDLVVLGDDRVVLTLVDVSGHGPVAGVFALRAKSLLLAALRDGLEPGAALGWVADQLGDTGETFLTGVVVELDGRAGIGRYANAGHPPALLSTDRGVVRLGATGPLLGPLPARWETEQITLPESSLLVACTDGLVEARDGGDREFGMGRLRELVAAHDDACPTTLVDRCVAEVTAFAGGRLADDLTVVALARSGVAAGPAGGHDVPAHAAVDRVS